MEKLEKKIAPHVCPHQFAFFLDNFIRKMFQHPHKILKEYINEGFLVVDIGCGPGYFTIPMAKMVGSKGKVIAVDLQEKMLGLVKKKAHKNGVKDRVETFKCQSEQIGLKLEQKADFILAAYMVHETPDPINFLKEVKEFLKVGGKLLIIEPKMHVSLEKFQQLLDDAKKLGYKKVEFPKKKGGRSVLFTH